MELPYLFILDNTKKLKRCFEMQTTTFPHNKVGMSDKVLNTWLTHFVTEVGNYKINTVLSLKNEDEK
jgi:hypothetical protein